MEKGNRNGTSNRHRTQGWKILLRDIVLFGIALNVFALFHHVLPRKLQPADNSGYAASSPSAAPETTVSMVSPVLAVTPSAPTPAPSSLAGTAAELPQP